MESNNPASVNAANSIKYAYVKFAEPCTNKGEKHADLDTIPITHIVKFDPKKLVNRAYRVKCGKGICRGTVLFVGESLVDIAEKMAEKRVVFPHPKVIKNASDSSSASETKAKKKSSVQTPTQEKAKVIAAMKLKRMQDIDNHNDDGHTLKSKPAVKQYKRPNDEAALSDAENPSDLDAAPKGSCIKGSEESEDSGLASSIDDRVTKKAAAKKPKTADKIPVAKSVEKKPQSAGKTLVLKSAGKKPPSAGKTTLLKSTQNKPKSADKTPVPQPVEKKRKSAEQTPVLKSAEKNPQSAGKTPVLKSIENNPKSADKTPVPQTVEKKQKSAEQTPVHKSTEKKPKSADKTPVPKSTEKKPKSADKTPVPKSAETKPKSANKTPVSESTKKKPQSAGKTPSVSANQQSLSAFRLERSTGGALEALIADDHASTKTPSKLAVKSIRQLTKNPRDTPETAVRGTTYTADDPDSSMNDDRSIESIPDTEAVIEDGSENESEDESPQMQLSDIDSDTEVLPQDGVLLLRKDPKKKDIVENADFNTTVDKLMSELNNTYEEDWGMHGAGTSGTGVEPLSPVKASRRSLELEVRLLRIMNLRLQQQLDINSNQVKATLENVELEARQDINERISSGKHIKVGFKNLITGKMHAGYGFWINTRAYDDLRTKTALTPSIFIGNVATLIFTEQTMRISSVTGRISNAHQYDEDGNRMAAKPALDPIGLDAVAAITRYWMTSALHATEEQIVTEISNMRAVIAHKISDMNRKCRRKCKAKTGNESEAPSQQGVEDLHANSPSEEDNDGDKASQEDSENESTDDEETEDEEHHERSEEKVNSDESMADKASKEDVENQSKDENEGEKDHERSGEEEDADESMADKASKEDLENQSQDENEGEEDHERSGEEEDADESMADKASKEDLENQSQDENEGEEHHERSGEEKDADESMAGAHESKIKYKTDGKLLVTEMSLDDSETGPGSTLPEDNEPYETEDIENPKESNTDKRTETENEMGEKSGLIAHEPSCTEPNRKTKERHADADDEHPDKSRRTVKKLKLKDI